MIRRFIAKHIWAVDNLFHKFGFPRHNICLAADVTVGWGPGCPDWKENETSFLKWFYKWYWNGMCAVCWGQGYIEYLHPVEEIIPCEECNGTGRLQ